jgi:hypothetical protein
MFELVIVCSCTSGLAEGETEARFRGALAKDGRKIPDFEECSGYSADL